jgi:UDP-N-acetylglucosamine 2-epimerase
VIFPVHPNPAVRETVNGMLTRNQAVMLCEPMAYTELIRVMASATLILTDSGGIQEEAPTLKKPVLIMRDHTERPEILESGFGRLVGTDTEKIVSTVERILLDDKLYESMRGGKNPFGDGLAAKRIVNVISKYFNPEAVEDIPMFK